MASGNRRRPAGKAPTQLGQMLEIERVKRDLTQDEVPGVLVDIALQNDIPRRWGIEPERFKLTFDGYRNWIRPKSPGSRSGIDGEVWDPVLAIYFYGHLNEESIGKVNVLRHADGLSGSPEVATVTRAAASSAARAGDLKGAALAQAEESLREGLVADAIAILDRRGENEALKKLTAAVEALRLESKKDKATIKRLETAIMQTSAKVKEVEQLRLLSEEKPKTQNRRR